MAMRDDVSTTAGSDPTAQGFDRARPRDVPWPARLWARMFAARYDVQVEAGTRAAEGSPLAAHCARLSSRSERRDLEQALLNVLTDAGLADGCGRTTRVPVQIDAVHRSGDLVYDVIARLAGPLPVRRRGVARLRILLSDGRGPLYRHGSSTLAAAMRGVLAAL